MSRMETAHAATREWWRQGHRVIECATCGYRHLHPYPSPGELAAFYREQYHRETKRFPYHAMDDAAIARRLAQTVQNREYREIFRAVATHLGQDGPGAMLDVGGGNSLLARYFTDQGWRGVVLEPNRDAATYLRRCGVPVVEAMFEDEAVRPLGRYTFINLQFVLEHVLAPREALARAVGLLEPGGLLRVVVPNDFSPGQLAWLAGSEMEPPWISYPDHINYFDRPSLTRLLQGAGLEVVGQGATFPLEFLLLTGTDYYRDENARKRVGAAVAGFEQAWRTSGQEDRLTDLYERLAELGLGRSVILYARQPV